MYNEKKYLTYYIFFVWNPSISNAGHKFHKYMTLSPIPLTFAFYFFTLKTHFDSISNFNQNIKSQQMQECYSSWY